MQKHYLSFYAPVIETIVYNDYIANQPASGFLRPRASHYSVAHRTVWQEFNGNLQI
jgi:hypothetical protein